MTRPIFRKDALEQLSSSDELDRLLAVTSPRAWLLLSAAGLVVAAAAAWAVAGSVSTTVPATGIIAPEGGYFQVAATSGGRLLSLDVTAGDVVGPDQVVAVIAQPELLLELEQAESRLATLEARQAERTETVRRQLELLGRQFDAEQASVEAEADAARREVEWIEARVAQIADAAERGIVRADLLTDHRRELDVVRERLREALVRLRRIEADRAVARERAHQELETLRDEVESVAMQIQQLRLQARESGRVVARRPGRVLDASANVGDYVAAGAPLLTLERVGRPLQAFVFAGAEARRARPGMPARILPDVLSREEHGYMRGRVVSVSDVPATRAELESLLANAALVDRILERVGPPYVIVASLEAAPGSPSGYVWTVGAGPEFAISSGMLASGRIVVDERRPISYVLPILREATGL